MIEWIAWRLYLFKQIANDSHNSYDRVELKMKRISNFKHKWAHKYYVHVSNSSNILMLFMLMCGVCTFFSFFLPSFKWSPVGGVESLLLFVRLHQIFWAHLSRNLLTVHSEFRYIYCWWFKRKLLQSKGITFKHLPLYWLVCVSFNFPLFHIHHLLHLPKWNGN